MSPRYLWLLLAVIILFMIGVSLLLPWLFPTLSWSQTPFVLGFGTILITGLALIYVMSVIQGVLWLYSAVADAGSHERAVLREALPHLCAGAVAAVVTGIALILGAIFREDLRNLFTASVQLASGIAIMAFALGVYYLALRLFERRRSRRGDVGVDKSA